MICRTQTIPYYSLNATLFRFEPIVICIFPSFFSCYFSRNQNGKGSSYGLLFSHVETILVMVSKESLAVSGISQRVLKGLSGLVYILCLFLLAEKIMIGVEKFRWYFLIVGRKNSSACKIFLVVISLSYQPPTTDAHWRLIPTRQKNVMDQNR